MKFTVFMNLVKDRVQETLGDTVEVKVRSVLKNNSVRLWGLIITEDGKNISPTIYLECFYEAYEKGTAIDTIVEAIVDSYRNVPKELAVNMDFFKDFEKVKDRVAYRLVNLENNKELLADVPFIPYLDLAICFYYAFGDTQIGEGAILIQRSHLEMWHTDEKELFSLAQENTSKLYPFEIMRMRSVMEQILGAQDLEILDEIDPASMYVLTNKKRIQGAATILYPEVLEHIGDKLGKDFYIIPSSVHEVILMPMREEPDRNVLKDMIYEVNRTQLAPEDVLSDSLYFYNRKDKRIIKL
ncbi:MAG: hypothetical protein IJ324_04650 [Lachnospiraceae bacterium]|nr:hypothetical protein [Lachnospiraceae bacterium]